MSLRRYGFLLPVLLACSNNTHKASDNEEISKIRNLEGDELVKRGAYMVTAGHCNDCHSPKLMTPEGPIVDTSKLLSGHPAGSQLPRIEGHPNTPGNWIYMAPDITAFVGPWGISYAANLTPDSATGIGAWTEELFVKTLRTGKHLGQENGRPILPPMPWENIRLLSDEDIRALYSYLRSLPPLSNKVPNPTPPTEVVR